MKISVYSPAKDEEDNVIDWAASAEDADEIVLVDTGSTDKTLDMARSLGLVKVRQASIVPWRFDDGFNAALSHVAADADICVPLHLDERLQPGWREEIEKVWTPEVGRISFRYQWNEDVEYLHDRIHAREARWIGAAHEFPMVVGRVAVSDLRIVQKPSARDRVSDGTLMELAYNETHSPRATYYWARECFFRGRWEQARKLFWEYLMLGVISTDSQERSEACRFMAKMVWTSARESWLLRACSEAPNRRECWVDLARYYRETGQHEAAVGAVSRALSIYVADESNSFYREKEAWDDHAVQRLLSQDES